MDELQAIRERYRRASGDLLTRDAAWLMNEVDTLRATIEAKDKAFDEMTDEYVEIVESKDVEIANTQAERDTEVRKSIRLHMTNVGLSDSLMEALEDNRAWSRQVDTLRATIEAKNKAFDEMTDRYVEIVEAKDAEIASEIASRESMRQQFADVSEKHDAAEARVKELRADLTDERSRIIGLNDRIATMEQDLAEAKKDANRVKATYARHSMKMERELAEEREMSDEVAKTNLSMACQLAEAKKDTARLAKAERAMYKACTLIQTAKEPGEALLVLRSARAAIDGAGEG